MVGMCFPRLLHWSAPFNWYGESVSTQEDSPKSGDDSSVVAAFHESAAVILALRPFQSSSRAQMHLRGTEARAISKVAADWDGKPQALSSTLRDTAADFLGDVSEQHAG